MIYCNLFQDIEPFWPIERELAIGQAFHAKMVQEGEDSGVVFSDFILNSDSGEFIWPLRMYFFPTWPRCDPIIKVFKAVDQVRHWNVLHKNGPILVIDR